MLVLLTYMRESIIELLFELFLRSVSSANSKKQNSFVLFIVNFREFRSSRTQVLLVLAMTYHKTRGLAKKFVPNYSAIHNRVMAQLNGEDNQRLSAKISE